MAIDYSKLSDEDLEGLANNDYSKLSDETLKMLAEEGQPARTPEEGTQGTNPINAAVGAAQVAGHYAMPALKGAYHVVSNPGLDLAAYLAARSKLGQSVMQGARALPGRVAGALPEATNVPGLVPAAAFSMPYAMAAHEQAKIRANPTAPQYATNPYAMSVRSQGTQQPITQGQAGAINQRAAAHNVNTAGNPMPGTPEFAQMQNAIGGPAAAQGSSFIDEIRKKYGGFFGTR